MSDLFEDPFDPKKLLPTRVRQAPVWADFADAIRTVLGRNIYEPMTYLLNARDPLKFRRGRILRRGGAVYKIEDVVHKTSFYPDPPIADDLIVSDGVSESTLEDIHATNERDLLIRSSQEMGFNILADRMNDEDLVRLNMTLGEFYLTKGTDSFIDYIGYLKGVRFIMKYMWARFDANSATYVDLTNDVASETGDTIIDDPVDGVWYPTNHVTVEYDDDLFPDVVEADFIELFNKFAPIHLVLHSFAPLP